MTWLSALLMLLKYLPAIVEAIKRGEAFVELRIQLGKVDTGIDKAKSTKDTSGLEKLLDPPSDPGSTPPTQH